MQMLWSAFKEGAIKYGPVTVTCFAVGQNFSAQRNQNRQQLTEMLYGHDTARIHAYKYSRLNQVKKEEVKYFFARLERALENFYNTDDDSQLSNKINTGFWINSGFLSLTLVTN